MMVIPIGLRFRAFVTLIVLLLSLATPVKASELFDAVMAEDAAGVVAALAAGADVNQRDASSRTALHMAASRKSAEIVVLLLDAGADVDAEADATAGRVHPLHWAANFGRAANVKALLEHGAKVDVVTLQGDTALLLAAKSGHVEVAEALLQAGANPLAEEATYGDTPIYLAAMAGHVKLVELMVANGVDVNLRNSRTGETPLWVAAMDDRVEVIAYLLASGADPNIANASGSTPIKMAISKNVKDMLRKSGARD